ncbi:MAG: metal ABC transporter substrate-binding protein, partial [Eubacteriales bacterium]|nr:metal ABC transporter substrate-binding protein [Eubacteriales bacterium]
MFKKFTVLFLSAILAISPVFALGQSEDIKQIVCSSFPYYDFVLNILGENSGRFHVELLQDSGMDLHNFQPTAADFINVSSADLLIYNGGPNEKWTEDAVKEAKNEQIIALNLLESLGDTVKMTELVEGMQAAEHKHAHEDEHSHEEE